MGFGAELKGFASGFRQGVQLANQTRDSQDRHERYRQPKESELSGDGPFGDGGGTVDTKAPRVDQTQTSSVAKGEIADYIRQSAAKFGIDPEVAIRVAQSEGGLTDPFRQGEAMLKYGREESYGPFQLHMRMGGVGERALKEGIDPRKDWKAGVDYALQEASQKGWGQWFGAAKAGIKNWQGIGGPKRSPSSVKPTPHTTNDQPAIPDDETAPAGEEAPVDAPVEESAAPAEDGIDVSFALPEVATPEITDWTEYARLAQIQQPTMFASAGGVIPEYAEGGQVEEPVIAPRPAVDPYNTTRNYTQQIPASGARPTFQPRRISQPVMPAAAPAAGDQTSSQKMYADAKAKLAADKAAAAAAAAAAAKPAPAAPAAPVGLTKKELSLMAMGIPVKDWQSRATPQQYTNIQMSGGSGWGVFGGSKGGRGGHFEEGGVVPRYFARGGAVPSISQEYWENAVAREERRPRYGASAGESARDTAAKRINRQTRGVTSSAMPTGLRDEEPKTGGGKIKKKAADVSDETTSGMTPRESVGGGKASKPDTKVKKAAAPSTAPGRLSDENAGPPPLPAPAPGAAGTPTAGYEPKPAQPGAIPEEPAAAAPGPTAAPGYDGGAILDALDAGGRISQGPVAPGGIGSTIEQRLKESPVAAPLSNDINAITDAYKAMTRPIEYREGKPYIRDEGGRLIPYDPAMFEQPTAQPPPSTPRAQAPVAPIPGVAGPVGAGQDVPAGGTWSPPGPGSPRNVVSSSAKPASVDDVIKIVSGGDTQPAIPETPVPTAYLFGQPVPMQPGAGGAATDSTKEDIKATVMEAVQNGSEAALTKLQGIANSVNEYLAQSNSEETFTWHDLVNLFMDDNYRGPDGKGVGFAAGGVVPDDEEEEGPRRMSPRLAEAGYTTSATGERSSARAPAPAAEEAPRQTANVKPTKKLRDDVAVALDGGIKFLTRTFRLGGSGGAMPSPDDGPAQQEGMTRLVRGEGAATPDEITGIDDNIDPDRELDEGFRQMNRYAATMDFYRQRGRKEEAEAAAAALLQYGSQRFGRLGSLAAEAYGQYEQTGDKHHLEQAVHALEQAYKMVPDGATVDVSINPETNDLQITKIDAEGNESDVPLKASDLPAVIKSVQSGSEYWKQIYRIADPAGAKEEATAARQEARDDRTLVRQEIGADRRAAASEAAADKRHERELAVMDIKDKRALAKEERENKRRDRETARRYPQMNWDVVTPLLADARAKQKVAMESEDEADIAAYNQAASAVFDEVKKGDRDPAGVMADLGVDLESFDLIAAPAGGQAPAAAAPKQAPDGKWYKMGPNGKYIEVEPVS